MLQKFLKEVLFDECLRGIGKITAYQGAGLKQRHSIACVLFAHRQISNLF